MTTLPAIRRNTVRYLLSFSFLLLTAPALSAQLTQEGVNRADATITPADVAQHIDVIAHDSMRGRLTPSPELNQVAGYIAGQFAEMGLRPLGDAETFIQEYAIRMTRLQSDRVTVRLGERALSVDGELRLAFANDLPENIVGDVVLAHGSPAAGMPETSFRGKIVLFVLPSPSGALTPELFQNMPAIATQGPAAVLIISDRDASAFADSRATFDLEIPQTTWSSEGLFGFPVMETRRDLLRDVLAEQGVDLDAAFAESDQALTATPLPDLEVELRFPRTVLSTESAPNVVGLWEGSDPELRDEYVIVSAHMDHIGAGPAMDGDSINNGADDDASGTAAILEMAEAFVDLGQAPRRSIIFLAVSGEEQGLWGSDYFTTHSPVDLTNVVANLNLDMIGRNSPDTIVAIGQEHSNLGETLGDVVGRHPEFGLSAIADPWPEEQIFFRSDHFNFAKRGIPILFLTSGTHDDYHQVTDELENLDTDKVSRVARMMFHMAMAVAQISERPEWNQESYKAIVAGGGN
jgi:hypothetical protein